LYDLLYVRKWSRHNPQLRASYIHRVLKENIFPGLALVDRSGRVDAAYGAWTRARLFYVPILGYDIHAPKKVGLYRMISAMSSQDAADRDALVHDSAGVPISNNTAGQNRCSNTMVFDSHLPRTRRPWRVLGALMRNIGVPLIERFNFVNDGWPSRMFRDGPDRR
jgi:hypothetical protein